MDELAHREWAAKARAWLPILGALAIAGAVHAPSLGSGLVGDDYQWWLHARTAIEAPHLLLAPFTAYRPALTWLFALDYLAFGTSPFGYHAVVLGLHLLCGGLLWWFLSRFALGPAVRAGIVLLWLCSPFSFEPVHNISSSSYLQLLACWLGLGVLWPGPGRRWSRRRMVLAFVLAGLTVFILESWVVLPALVLVWDLCVSRARPAVALRRSALSAVPVLLYVVAYFTFPPFETGSYYTNSIVGAVKIPHIWAAFCGLTTLRPLQFVLGFDEALALLVIAGLAWLGVRSRSRLVLVGAAFYLLPLLPLIPVEFLTTRYTTIPFVGFLLVVAGAAVEIRGMLPSRWVLASGWALGGLALLYLVAGLFWVSAETADRRELDEMHQDLVAEAVRFAPRMPVDRVVVSVRREREQPLLLLSRSGVGLPKIHYHRHPDPYALIDTAALWSWVLDARGGTLFRYLPPEQVRDVPFAVVAHDVGGFVELEASGSLVRTVSRWKGAAYHVRVMNPWRPVHFGFGHGSSPGLDSSSSCLVLSRARNNRDPEP